MTSPSSLAIYLASASPRRHQLLNQIGVAHDVLDVPSPPGEDEPRLPGEAAAHYVRRTAIEKAERARQWVIQQALPARPILAADTTVILQDDVLGKPTDADDAARMLARLSGRSHEVRSVVVLVHGGATIDTVSITEVTFRTLSDLDIERYCASGEPFGKAGSYGIQGLAGAFIERIAGSYTGVMGLPIFETAQLLKRCSIHVP